MLLNTLLILQLATSVTHAGEAKIFPTVQKYALKYGLDPYLVQAIIAVESNYNIKAIGTSHGEIGLMQLRPKYFPKATFDIEQNVAIGTKHLAEMQKLCQSKYGDAWFVCYNVGPNRFLKYPTKHLYYRKVYAKYNNNRMRYASRDN